MSPQSLQNQSSDIRLVSERVLWWVFREEETPSMEASLIKPLLKSLLDNTKDKNTSVRAQSEYTIVNLLRLRQGDTTMQVRMLTVTEYYRTTRLPASPREKKHKSRPIIHYISFLADAFIQSDLQLQGHSPWSN